MRLFQRQSCHAKREMCQCLLVVSSVVQASVEHSSQQCAINGRLNLSNIFATVDLHMYRRDECGEKSLT
jgi:hypothetical protein